MPPVSVIARSVITWRYGRGLRADDADAVDGAVDGVDAAA
jgi:hypothetical protein